MRQLNCQRNFGPMEENAGAPVVEPPNPIMRAGDERARNGVCAQPISTKFLLDNHIHAKMKDFFQFCIQMPREPSIPFARSMLESFVHQVCSIDSKNDRVDVPWCVAITPPYKIQPLNIVLSR